MIYIQYEATESNFIQPHFDVQKQDYTSQQLVKFCHVTLSVRKKELDGELSHTAKFEIIVTICQIVTVTVFGYLILITIGLLILLPSLLVLVPIEKIWSSIRFSSKVLDWVESSVTKDHHGEIQL